MIKDNLSFLKQQLKIWLSEKTINNSQYKKILSNYNLKIDQAEDLIYIKISSLLSIFFIMLGSFAVLVAPDGASNMFFNYIWGIISFFIFISTGYLATRYKDLNLGFIGLWLITCFIGLSIAILYNLFDIQIPYYFVFFLWFLFIFIFSWQFKFRHFFVMSILVLYVGIVFYSFAFFYEVKMSVIIFMIASISSLFAIFIKIKSFSKSFLFNKSFYKYCFSVSIGFLLFINLLLVNPNIINLLHKEKLMFLESGNSFPIIIIIFSFLPFFVSLLYIILSLLKNKNIVKHEILGLIKDFFIGFMAIYFLSNSMELNYIFTYTLTNLWIFISIIRYFVLGVQTKNSFLVNISFLGVYLYFIFNYIAIFSTIFSPLIFMILGIIIFLSLSFVMQLNKLNIINYFSKFAAGNVTYKF